MMLVTVPQRNMWRICACSGSSAVDAQRIQRHASAGRASSTRWNGAFSHARDVLAPALMHDGEEDARDEQVEPRVRAKVDLAVELHVVPRSAPVEDDEAHDERGDPQAP